MRLILFLKGSHFKMKKLKHILFLQLISILLFSCSHSIKIRSSYFLTPTTSEKQWGGSAGIVTSEPSVITLVDDVNTNPPLRNGIKINDSSDVSSVLALETWVDWKLSVFNSIELFYTDYVAGAKWQFLNHNAKQNWVASVMGGYGMKNTETSSNSNKSKTELTTTRAGLSVGYQNPGSWVPYISYIYQNHKTDTTVDNSFGAFGSYLDEGIHQNYALGIASTGPGLNAGLEYNYISMVWNGTSKGSHSVLGAMLNYAW